MSTEIPESFVVNGFIFCTKHGGEVCNECGVDYRVINNSKMDKSKVMASVAKGFDLDERTALRAYYLGAVYTGRHRECFGIFQCTEHKKDDCLDCFDWNRILIELSQQKDLEGKIYLRNDLIGLLKSMGVEFPHDTKLLDDILDTKLTSALTMSQNLTDVVKKLPLNPSKLPRWTAPRVHEAMARTSPAEAMARQSSIGDPFPLYVNTWMDARQTTMHLARNFESGVKVMVLQDEKDHNEAIAIRVLGVHKLDKKTPLVSLIYCSSDMASPPANSLDWFRAQMATGSLGQVTCTPQEQALLRKLLYQNSKRVSTDFKPSMETYEHHFKPSFVVPLNPLDQADVGKLVHNTGCHICGKKMTSRCSQCLSVSYCGPACQKGDWINHKVLCKALKGGVWVPMTFSKHPVIGGKKMYSQSFSNTGTLKIPSKTQLRKEHEDDNPPPNIHSEEPFLVKVQRPVTPGDPNAELLLVYDWQRSFKVYVMPEENVAAYGEARKQIAIRNNRNKVYRWAKRTGDWTLEVCLDRIPDPEPMW